MRFNFIGMCPFTLWIHAYFFTLNTITEGWDKLKKVITIEYEEEDVFTTDDKKMVAFYLMRGEQLLYPMVGYNDKILYAFSKTKTYESFRAWREMKPRT